MKNIIFQGSTEMQFCFKIFFLEPNVNFKLKKKIKIFPIYLMILKYMFFQEKNVSL